MDIAAKPASATLEIRRTFNTTRDKVFNAWANASAIAQWIGPADQMDSQIEAHDFQAGGEFRYRLITKNDDPIRGPAGINHVAAGNFVEIEEPSRIVFTWQWIENGMDIGQTLVTLEFIEQDNKTELILLHEKLPTTEAREAHRDGWEGWLRCLDNYLHLSHT